MNINVLHIDCCGEGFKRMVVKAVQRRHQSQVFPYSLREGLCKRVVLYRQGHIVAKQIE